MRTLTDVLVEAKRAEREGTNASPLLAEVCRILASVADQDRLPYGERRVGALVEDILATTNADWATTRASVGRRPGCRCPGLNCSFPCATR